MGEVSYTDLDLLLGYTLTAVRTNDRGTEIYFDRADGVTIRMFHLQDCWESVRIEDICGDLSDLIGSPLLVAEEATRRATFDEAAESGTWTFYRFRTLKGSVDIRWLGTSNGRYSENVEIAALSASEKE